MARIFWFRRDLRLQDNVALNSAIAGSKEDGDGEVCGLYVLETPGFHELFGIRQGSLAASLRALNASMAGHLVVRNCNNGELAAAIVAEAVAAEVKLVHATRAFDTDGVAEQNRVGLALKAAGIHLLLDDSYYAVSPGTVLKPDASPYRVYTPFFKNWLNAGWSKPVALAEGFTWFCPAESDGVPKPSKPAPFEIRAGEAFALRTLRRFLDSGLQNYDEMRNRADLSGTSHLSHALSFGEIHPRTILAAIGHPEIPNSSGVEVFRKEIAWREFYADVLWHNPTTTTDYYEPRYKRMRYDSGPEAEAKLLAWQQGKTGFPMVDAGMRQLLATGWMHNRVRMIVASFLIKDLHLEWQLGAEWFEQNLSDFDPASNAHGWQWTAGCGTDASPYFRVFNPVLQGHKFDPNGDYVRKFVPELANIAGGAVNEPWLLAQGLFQGVTGGYPEPIVDHATERDESLARLAEIKLAK